MKKIFLILLVIFMAANNAVVSQDTRAIRAARSSFQSAENNFKKNNFQQAAREYLIVVNSIPGNIDSRRDLNMRLNSVIKLIDISFNKSVNFNDACDYVHEYLDNVNSIRNSGILRSSELFEFQKIEQEYINDYIPKCENIDNSKNNMDNFRMKFEEEF